MPKCPTCNSVIPFKITVPSTKTVRPIFQINERMEHGVIVPFLQAGGYLFLIGLFGTVVCSALFPGYSSPYLIGLTAGLGVSIFVWDSSLKDDRQRLWYKLENMLGVDLNRDGHIGEPQEEPAADIWVPHKEDGRKIPAWRRYEIPWSNKREAQMVARAVTLWGKDFSRRVLIDMNVLPNDNEHFQRIRKAMIKGKLVEDTKGKTILTDMGMKYLRGCLTTPPQGG